MAKSHHMVSASFSQSSPYRLSQYVLMDPKRMIETTRGSNEGEDHGEENEGEDDEEEDEEDEDDERRTRMS